MPKPFLPLIAETFLATSSKAAQFHLPCLASSRGSGAPACEMRSRFRYMANVDTSRGRPQSESEVGPAVLVFML